MCCQHGLNPRRRIETSPLPSQILQQALARASKKASDYLWLEAAAICEEALGTGFKEELSEQAEAIDFLGKCYFRAGFQQASAEGVKQKIDQARVNYEKAESLHETAGQKGLSKLSKSRSLFCASYLDDSFTGKRTKVREAITLAQEATSLFQQKSDRRMVGYANKEILNFFGVGIGFWSENWEKFKEVFELFVRAGDVAVETFEALGEDEALLESLSQSILYQSAWFDYVYGPSDVEPTARKLQRYVKRVEELSRKLDTPYTVSIANLALSLATLNFETDYTKVLSLAETGASAAEKTGDSFLMGTLSGFIMYAARDRVLEEDDIEVRRALLERAIAAGPVCITKLSHSSPTWHSWAYTINAGAYKYLATFVEADVQKKRVYLQMGIELARKSAQFEGYWPFGPRLLAEMLLLYATLSPDLDEKARLLKDALLVAEGAARKLGTILNPLAVDQGVASSVTAAIRAELSKLEENPAKAEILRRATAEMDKCVALCKRWETTVARGESSRLHRYYELNGDILTQLYGASGEDGLATKAVKAYEDAIRRLDKLGLVASIAPLRWKIARNYDSLRNYEEAINAFRQASEAYKLGAQKVPGSSQAFSDLASYMDAWASIEQARSHHTQEQYGLAAESYARAAGALNRTRDWNYLGKHYEACSQLERAEATSRLEKPDAAVDEFSAATRAFKQAVVELEKARPGAEESGELREWSRVMRSREKYSEGRLHLEEGKDLDRKGDEEGSLQKFRLASDTFKHLLGEPGSEESWMELKTLMLFGEAWSRMKDAEIHVSAELYTLAAESFAQAEKAASTKRSRLLALANASICRALESGTLFRRTRNTELFAEIKKQLETSTDYYQQAGMQSAADWARATQRMFDALVYTADAETEKDARKRTELYHLAEKHLQLAGKLYAQAGFPSKNQEALKHLERVREEKALLLTPIEALAESPAITGISAFPASLTQDQATGLEKFQVAQVVGNLSISKMESGVGSDLSLELEIANVGKTAATLLKLENIVPDGLELNREKIASRLEDNYLDMKGKRLEYLKTHEVRIPLKAARKGAFEVRPRILFVDEAGSYRSYQFEPAHVTIKELGISGWLKGPK